MTSQKKRTTDRYLRFYSSGYNSRPFFHLPKFDNSLSFLLSVLKVFGFTRHKRGFESSWILTGRWVRGRCTHRLIEFSGLIFCVSDMCRAPVEASRVRISFPKYTFFNLKIIGQYFISLKLLNSKKKKLILALIKQSGCYRISR